MRSSTAIFIKQFQDVFKNKGALLQFVTFPIIAFVMTNFVDERPDGMPDTIFISMFATMFIGMSMIAITSHIIAEDREKKSLRFLMMAGVKSHEYLLGVGGVLFVCVTVVSLLFVAMMPDKAMAERLIYLASLLLGGTASILFGAILGMLAKNEQAATSYGMTAGLLMGFGPMVAAFNYSLGRMFSIFYTMNFIYHEAAFAQIPRQLGIISLNVAVLGVVFAWIYRKNGLRP